MCLTPIAIIRTDKRYFKNHGVTTYTQKVSCGKCEQCLQLNINKWSKRLLLESYKYTSCVMVTFTMNEENYDFFRFPQNLKIYMQRMFKRIRKRKYKIKYYYVAEAGERTGRIHGHAIILINEKSFIKIFNLLDTEYQDKYCSHSKECEHNEFLKCEDPKCQNQMGFISVKKAHYGGIRYVVGYLKKQPLFNLISKGLGKFDTLYETAQYIKKEPFVHRYYFDQIRKIDEKFYYKFVNRLNQKERLLAFKKEKNSTHGTAARQRHQNRLIDKRNLLR